MPKQNRKSVSSPAGDDSSPELEINDRQRFWLNVLTAFPFYYVPILVVCALLASWIMPWLTGARNY